MLGQLLAINDSQSLKKKNFDKKNGRFHKKLHEISIKESHRMDQRNASIL